MHHTLGMSSNQDLDPAEGFQSEWKVTLLMRVCFVYAREGSAAKRFALHKVWGSAWQSCTPLSITQATFEGWGWAQEGMPPGVKKKASTREATSSSGQFLVPSRLPSLPGLRHVCIIYFLIPN